VVERIPQHRHCNECGKAIVSTEKYCSEECKTKRDTKLKQRKRQLLLLYFGSFIAFVILVMFSFVRF